MTVGGAGSLLLTAVASLPCVSAVCACVCDAECVAVLSAHAIAHSMERKRERGVQVVPTADLPSAGASLQGASVAARLQPP